MSSLPGNTLHDEPSGDEIDAVYAAQGYPNAEKRRQSFIDCLENINGCIESLRGAGQLPDDEEVLVTTSVAVDFTISSARDKPIQIFYEDTQERSEEYQPVTINAPSISLESFPRLIISGHKVERSLRRKVRLGYDQSDGHEIYLTDHKGHEEPHKHNYSWGVVVRDGKPGFKIK